MAVAVKKYNPGFLSDDEIIASFCVRTAEFDSLVESLRESDAGSSPHSLVIGPRGSGKTHLLLRVAAEVRRNPALTGLFPVTFAEESYEVTTCGEFWLECLGRLADQGPSEERDNLRLTYDELRTVTDDQALADRCIGSLLDYADRHETRLLLLVENLNMLFNDINDPDVGWKLRQTLQTEPRFILLGSATSRFDEIDNPDHALYDLFRIISLHPLDTTECHALWQSVAGKCSTTEAVRPLEILTGGNPRLLTIIARFGADRSFRDLMENLLDLVDDHTEYFKSHLEALPPQERRVYLALARLWKPSTAREVADNARLNTSTCSAQLKRLIARGAVTIEGGTPRRRQYYLTERLYNIYYLLRHGRTNDRFARALIDFMIRLYSPRELGRLLLGISRDSHARGIIDPKIAGHVASALLTEAAALAQRGKPDEALVIYDQVIQQLDSQAGASNLHQIGLAFTSKAVLLFKLERREQCIAACNEAVDQLKESEDSIVALQFALALGTRGMALVFSNKPAEALPDLDDAVANVRALDEPVPAFILATLIEFKGLALLQSNRFAESIQEFDEAIALGAIDPEHRDDSDLSYTLQLKALALNQIGQTVSEEEFVLILRFLSDEDGPLLDVTEALIPFVASVEPIKALALIESSPSQHLLLPLITALQQELGQTPPVAKEVAEVARDVRAKLAEARAHQAQARAQEPPLVN